MHGLFTPVKKLSSPGPGVASDVLTKSSLAQPAALNLPFTTAQRQQENSVRMSMYLAFMQSNALFSDLVLLFEQQNGIGLVKSLAITIYIRSSSENLWRPRLTWSDLRKDRPVKQNPKVVVVVVVVVVVGKYFLHCFDALTLLVG